jgi:tetratricopeptide (TPR) repeat protein
LVPTIRPAWPAVAGLVLLLASGLVHAQGSLQARQDATKHWKLANAAFDARDYQKAIAEYEEAYRLNANPQLLFNIAQAYRLHGDRDKAIDHYRRFLAQAKGRGVEEAKEHLAALEADHPPVPSSGSADAALGAPADVPPASQHVSGDVSIGASDQRADASAGRTERMWGVGVLTIGVAALGLGSYFAVIASRRSNEIQDSCPCLWKDVEHLDAEGHRAALGSKISFSAGAAAVIGGAALYYLGRRKRDAAVTSFVPVSGGLALTWTCAY